MSWYSRTGWRQRRLDATSLRNGIGTSRAHPFLEPSTQALGGTADCAGRSDKYSIRPAPNSERVRHTPIRAECAHRSASLLELVRAGPGLQLEAALRHRAGSSALPVLLRGRECRWRKGVT